MFPFHYRPTEAHLDLHLPLFCLSIRTDLSSSKHSFSALLTMCRLVDHHCSHTGGEDMCLCLLLCLQEYGLTQCEEMDVEYPAFNNLKCLEFRF